MTQISTASVQLQRDVQLAIRKLKKLPVEIQKKKKEILETAAHVVVEAARSNIPESGKPHKRYSTAKLTNKLRAPKGRGKVIATYYPGNLKRSIRILKTGKFRKLGSVFVGPKLIKRNTKGLFKGRRVDGYYAHFYEYGTPHYPGKFPMRRAAISSRKKVAKIVEQRVRRVIKDYVRKNQINGTKGSI